MSIEYLIHLLITFLLSGFLSYCAYRSLGKLGFLDFPNSRSLHFDPKPTSGGIAIVISFWIVILLSSVSYDGLWPWIMACTTFSILGMADDFKSVPILTRLALQFLIAFGLVIWLFFDLPIPVENILVLFGGLALIVVALVGSVNLFNFMDGADGFSGTQSIIYFFCHACMFTVLGLNHLSLLALTLTGILAGFMVFNWAPAKLFMGDSGSYFLGSFHFALGYLCFESGNGFFFSLILASPFLCDSVLTLLLRFFTSENWWEAHRSHCYQLMVRNGMSPQQLALGLSAFHIVCFIPLCFLTLLHPDSALYFVLFAYSVTVFIWYYLRKLYLGTK